MIAVIDYGVGNIRSVMNALGRLGCEAKLTGDVAEIMSSDKVILPGVGDCAQAMYGLRESGLAEIVPQIKVPVLGICVGLQMMCRHSEENDAQGLGIFPTDVLRFDGSLKAEDGSAIKIPHMGWNALRELRGDLFRGLDEGSFVYYVHSYYPQICDYTIARSNHGVVFSGALARDNFYGCQFHPEKSAAVGEKILDNFLKL